MLTPRLRPEMLLVAVIAAPLVAVLMRLGADTGGLWSHLASTVLPRYATNTLVLVVSVSALTFVFGVGSAWLVTLCDFPGRRVLAWALVLPLAIPAYLGAYALTDLLQFSGPVQTGLRQLLPASAGWFPSIRSLPGATLVLALAFYPYVYLAARSAFIEQSQCVLEVSRTLGSRPWRTFRVVALPLARPAIAGGMALVVMETLAEFGAVQHCAVDTFATGIYRTFTLPNEFALPAAAQLSALLLVAVTGAMLAERLLRGDRRFHQATPRYRSMPRQALGRVAAPAALAFCAIPVFGGFVVPVLVFLIGAVRHGDLRARELLLEYGMHSVRLGLVAAAVAVLLSWWFVSRLELRRPSWIERLTLQLVGLGYATPGAVIAIGVLVVMTGLDRTLQSWIATSTGGALTGTVLALVYGYQARFLGISVASIEAAYLRLRPAVVEVARTLGARPLRTELRVRLPMVKGSIAAAALLVFVEVLKELPMTLILRPFGSDTLAVRVYQLASDERLGEASTGALAIIAVSLVAVLGLTGAVEKGRPGANEEYSGVWK